MTELEAAEFGPMPTELTGNFDGAKWMKLLVNQALYAQGLHTTQALGTVFDGLARHTPEGYAFQGLAAREGFRAAVRERDEPFGDLGPSTFKG